MSNPSTSRSRMKPISVLDWRETSDEEEGNNVLVAVFTSDGSDADKENTRKKKKTKKKKTQTQVDEPGTSTEAAVEPEVQTSMSEYEQLRLENKAKCQEMLKQLGLPSIPFLNAENSSGESEPEYVPEKPKKRQLKKRSYSSYLDESGQPTIRESKRIRKIPAELVSESSQDNGGSYSESYIDERILDTVDLGEEYKNIFSNLNADGKYDHNVDIYKCDREKFRSQVLTFRMENKTKVTDGRVTSLFIHPSLSKILVLAGSKYGTLGIWDPKLDSEIAQFELQKSNINCLSASSSDIRKIYSTSHDGTIKMINIESEKIENLYATDFSDKVKHLTWHDELDEKTLLFSHGNGQVGVLDLRDRKVSLWANCYNRSCRTVHVNPVNKNLFLTSSGQESRATIFDVRHVKREAIPICDMQHPKGLTSAFFSHNAAKVLTTCNDDTVNIFNTVGLLERPKRIMSIYHNNHTGRWLSVFKAIWFPQRDDSFSIGALTQPRKIQVYGDNGKLIAELQDENMTTISPVISIHPKLPIIAGGNASGYAHLFWPPEIASAYKNSEDPV